MQENIYFCFPYKKVGGVSILFLRLAEELAKKNMANTFLIDYKDGYMARNYDPEISTLLEYSDDKYLVIPNDGVIIFQSMTPWSIFPKLKIGQNVRILFWSCYPYSLIPIVPGIRKLMQKNRVVARILLSSIFIRYANKMRNFTNLLISQNALVFQDKVSVDITEKYLDLKINQPNYLPVPSKKSEHNLIKQTPDIEVYGLKISCIGRIADFKFYTLIRFLEDLNCIAPTFNFPIQVNVIGSGDYLYQLQSETASFSGYTISFIDEIAIHELDNYLINDTDLLVAMGTTALEGIKLGVPTILLDISHERVPEGFTYSWFYEREHFILADVFNKHNLDLGNDSLIDHLGELINDYKNVSQRSIEHFNANHSIESVAKKFLNYALNTKLHWSQLEKSGFTKKDMFYNIYSKLKIFSKIK